MNAEQVLQLQADLKRVVDKATEHLKDSAAAKSDVQMSDSLRREGVLVFDGILLDSAGLPVLKLRWRDGLAIDRILYVTFHRDGSLTHTEYKQRGF